MSAVGGPLKPTFIQVDQLGRPLGQEDLAELLEISPALGWIPFSVPQSFFYASLAIVGEHTRWHGCARRSVQPVPSA